jgi:hypothetical protein
VIINEAAVESVGATKQQLQDTIDRETKELQRRVQAYRGGRPHLPVTGMPPAHATATYAVQQCATHHHMSTVLYHNVWGTNVSSLAGGLWCTACCRSEWHSQGKLIAELSSICSQQCSCPALTCMLAHGPAQQPRAHSLCRQGCGAG